MQDKTVVGAVEQVTVFGTKGKRRVLARIDTGAQSNSIDQKLAETLGTGQVIKTTTVKSAVGSSERPVVMLDIEIKGRKLNGRFTIADRSKLKYPILIGRNILKNGFLVDANESCAH
jgi:hypothetical protein